MKAAILTHYGLAEQLIIQHDFPVPLPAPNQVQVKVMAASLNPLDYKIRNGELRWIHPLKFPMVLGNDISGVVTAVGENVSQFKVGDEVFGMMDANVKPACNGFARPGAYAEYAVTREDTLALKPSGLTHPEAASLPLAALTAWQALHPLLSAIHPTQRAPNVLINGGSGGVGSLAVQIAKALGATVTATCSARNMTLVQSLGADRVIDYSTTPVTTVSGPFDLIYDVAANLRYRDIESLLTSEGVLITNVANIATMLAPLSGPIKKLFQKRKRYIHAWVRSSAHDLTQISHLVSSGQLRPVLSQCFALDEVNEAYQWLTSGRSHGKGVLQIA